MSAVVCVPIWAFLADRYNKRRVFSAAVFSRALASGIGFFVVDSVSAYVVCVVVLGSTFGGIFAVKFSMISDVADVEQWRAGGLRDEGKIIALFDVATKAAGGLLLAFSFLMIDMSGYSAGVVPQNLETQASIRMCHALVPAALDLAAAGLCFFLYPLDGAAHADIIMKLAAYRSPTSTSPEIKAVVCDGAGIDAAMASAPCSENRAPVENCVRASDATGRSENEPQPCLPNNVAFAHSKGCFCLGA